DPGAVLEGTVLLDGVVVGEGAQLSNVIVDKNVHIPPGARIGFDVERDLARGFEVSDGGVVAVAKNAEITEPV
ncbi:MAG TPA: glucose-1-phosphate adenylyltransferase, partial [Acidimicrobiia bacterium]|nr:glucose-1-phosphate adenylyltransferase [Acidimicrobiia bacterium]